MRAVEVGFDVVGFDIDDGRVKRLAAGESSVEDITDERLAAALGTGRYRPTADAADCAGFDVAVISVPTPLREGNPDLSLHRGRRRGPGAATCDRGRDRGPRVDDLPGHDRGARRPRSSRRVPASWPGADFHLGYSPERIDPGNPTWTLREHAQGGVRASTTPSLAAVAAVLRPARRAHGARVRRPKEAELTKLLENTFRHVNIALVNELAMFADDLGIDVWEAIDAASTKPFGYMRFTPGPGRRRALPADRPVVPVVAGAAARSGQRFRFVELANDVNDHMPDYVVRPPRRAASTSGGWR